MAYGTLKADSIVYDNSGSDVSVTVSNIVGSASPTFTGNVTINAQGDLRLADSDSSNYVGFQSPGTVSSNVLWTLPGADGSAGQQLTTDGSGTLSWSAAVNVAAGSLTGTTIASGVTASSLTSVGTLTGLTIDGDVTFTGASANGTWDKSADAFVGNLTGTASTATEATNVTVTANNSTNETVYPLFVDGATGAQGAETDTGLSYNPSTGQLTATLFVGAATALNGSRTIGGVVFDNTGNIDLPGVNTAGNQNTSGTAALATEVTVTANNSTDETVYPLFADGNTGSQGAETDTGLTYNPSSGLLTATGFSGAGTSLTALNASNLGSGTVATARLGSGTASSSTFLRGDGSWQAVTSTTINNNADNKIITGSGTANTLEAEASLLYTGSQLLVNTTADIGQNSPRVLIRGEDYTTSLGLMCNAANAGGGNISFQKSRATGQGDTTIVQAGDTLGTIYWYSCTGSSTFKTSARIDAIVESGVGTGNDSPGRLEFSTTPDGASGASLALKLDSSQNATFGGTVSDPKGNLRSVPTRNETSAYTLVAADAGKCITADNGVTVPNGVFAAGDVITIINMATSNKTITQGSGLTMRNVGDDGNYGNVSVKQYAMCTLIFTASSVCFFSTTAKA